MSNYPVRYHVDHPPRFERLQLLVRVVAFWALGLCGLSLGTVFLLLYLGLPLWAAIRLSARDPAGYSREDGPRIVRFLGWVAALMAWAGLITDRMPVYAPGETVELEIDRTAHPTPQSAMLRMVTGLPSAFILAILGAVGTLVWLWAALTIIVSERVGDGAFHYLVGVQRWAVRLLAYQASLVDEYPPFSLTDVPGAVPPPARATP
jgi:hypothetical protein